jgi:hypothetical protein
MKRVRAAWGYHCDEGPCVMVFRMGYRVGYVLLREHYEARIPLATTQHPSITTAILAVLRPRPANAAARRLLLSQLSPDQAQEYKSSGSFHVQGESGRLYRLSHAWAGNIQVVTKPWGDPLATLCIHPIERIPIEDSLLAQKLLIESDEDELHAIANRTVNENTSPVPSDFMSRYMDTEEGRAKLAESFRIPLRLRYLMDPRPETVSRYLRETLAGVWDHPHRPELVERIAIPQGVAAI